MIYYSIGAAAKRTGLSTHLIRSWETRYQAIVPSRTETNRRVYSDEDIERLRLLHRAKLAGRSISFVASVSTAELRRIVEQDESAEGEGSRPSRHGTGELDGATLLQSCHSAVQQLDAGRLKQVLHRASERMPLPHVLERVVAPLMQDLGTAWRTGALRPVHEHLATAVVKSYLGGLPFDAHGSPRELVVATPAGQIHELGALMAAAMAAAQGWRSTYVGASVSAETLAAAARKRDADAVALSIVFPVDDPNLGVELDELLWLLPSGLPILVGGQGASYYQDALDRVGARLVADYDSLMTTLGDLNTEGAPAEHASSRVGLAV